MAPSSLQGLNVVQQPVHDTTISDSQDLLSAPPFPDLSAQLELWTNLAFESDEPLVRHDDGKNIQFKNAKNVADDEDMPAEGSAAHEGHDNVVTGRAVPSSVHNAQQQAAFDLNQFLAGFGIDPFAVPPPVQPSQGTVPSLAQLLSLQPSHPAAFQQSQSVSTDKPQPAQETASFPPPSKRSRTRKSSVSTVDFVSPDTPIEPSFADSNTSSSNTPLPAAEDKRRRNTAASARFRLKKKEREAALEKKSKELEVRVNELERECEGLRRENGWLKGLVVGVTGAGATPQAPTGTKRPRDEVDGDGALVENA